MKLILKRPRFVPFGAKLALLEITSSTAGPVDNKSMMLRAAGIPARVSLSVKGDKSGGKVHKVGGARPDLPQSCPFSLFSYSNISY